ncbi:MAG: ComEA family DNA-binding protein [Chlamydiota bacterium]
MKLYFEERLAVFVLVGLLVAAAFWRAERQCPRALLPGDDARGGGTVAVTVMGAVSRPGEYRVARGACARDAARAAGPAADAALDALDRRVPCVGGEVVYVPRAGEGIEAQERNREEALRKIRRPARLRPVDINRASAEELAELPGVGEKLAGAVILERSRAPFRSVEDLRRVPGIGPKKLEKIRDQVAVGDRENGR